MEAFFILSDVRYGSSYTPEVSERLGEGFYNKQTIIVIITAHSNIIA